MTFTQSGDEFLRSVLFGVCSLGFDKIGVSSVKQSGNKFGTNGFASCLSVEVTNGTNSSVSGLRE